ncbi:metallophosphoesterase family protein [Geomesophilobacter sediminis]|uniref:Metallophosphoesterase n=1 Tax=Geomesophilobacter sediminis TaxID=2798584 RepID=A0A8J7JCI7_9BACT|nr:metallophosphoesterase [Geomesophilobacter sediminis]MBJ6724553.1 metallophosphoesterase [Geomesophilobacter sediminis]
MPKVNRRDFMRLMGLGTIGGAVFMSSGASAMPGKKETGDFYFLQLTDTHWGFSDPKVNPDFKGTLLKAVRQVNALKLQPDFIMFTGDLTHTTEDAAERKRRLLEFREVIKHLKVKRLMFIPGEHDASLDNGAVFKEVFGPTHYSFEHRGVHFLALDNVSDPSGSLGEAQLNWLGGELKKLDADARIVVFTHRPLFDLYPQWEWATPDGAKALELLAPFNNVTVFYGHIHQINAHVTGRIQHFSSKGLMYPLPAPGSQPKRAPVPWNPAIPYRGMGFRQVQTDLKDGEYVITETPLHRG